MTNPTIDTPVLPLAETLVVQPLGNFVDLARVDAVTRKDA
jgi:hypothetical protein